MAEEADDRIREEMSGRNHCYCIFHYIEGFQGIEAVSELHPVDLWCSWNSSHVLAATQLCHKE